MGPGTAVEIDQGQGQVQGQALRLLLLLPGTEQAPEQGLQPVLRPQLPPQPQPPPQPHPHLQTLPPPHTLVGAAKIGSAKSPLPRERAPPRRPLLPRL